MGGGIAYFVAALPAVIFVGLEILAAVRARIFAVRTADAALLVGDLEYASSDGAGDDVCEEISDPATTESLCQRSERCSRIGVVAFLDIAGTEDVVAVGELPVAGVWSGSPLLFILKGNRVPVWLLGVVYVP